MQPPGPEDESNPEQVRRISPPIRFVVYMGLYLAFFQWSYVQLSPRLRDVLVALGNATARVVSIGLELAGGRTTLHGDVVSLGGFSVRVITECTGLFEMVIFAACVLAYPASRRSKVIGIVFGFSSIYLFNVLRIALLLVVGRYANGLFDFFHIYFWQITLVGIIVANWLLWLNWIVRRETVR